MVSIKALVALVAINIISVTAIPVPEAGSSADASSKTIAARAASSIYMCEHEEWNGQCTEDSVELGTCKNVPRGWKDRITSIRNNRKDNSKCTWYL
ncbi:hypothetical protein AJ79_01379 [Helicocarpus griseus UAMH5409]|uniref:Uncharacterized protein n=1 Tax=Helicocarpus griseus UAMH5409 TaxID=1447875 RepID=A0A2B7Y6Z0_9EURO|nr:hypothetical protein AJ79_01379 [Helicocarpus griseus UAMH5409]